MGPDRLNEIIRSNEIGAEKAPVRPQSSLRRALIRASRYIPNVPILGGLAASIAFPGIARAEVQPANETPNQETMEVVMDNLPALEGQTPPAEAVAGVVDVAETIIEPAPAPEVLEAKPIYASPNGVLTAEDQPDWQTRIRFTGEKISDYEKELLKTGVKFEFIPDDSLNLDLSNGRIDKGQPIFYNSCLGIGISRQGAMGCYDSPWLIYQAKYDSKPGVVIVHYKEFTNPTIPPNDYARERLKDNINNSLIPIWTAHALNEDVNSDFRKNLSTSLSNFPGVEVTTAAIAAEQPTNS